MSFIITVMETTFRQTGLIRIFLTLLLGFTVVPAVLAGNVYGTIREGNSPVRSAAVSIICGTESVPGRTDAEGVYRLFTKATGNCQFVVELPGRKLSVSMYSFDRPTAYDFDVVRDGTNWILRKR